MKNFTLRKSPNYNLVHFIRIIVIISLLSTFILPSFTLADSNTIVVKLWVGNPNMSVNGVMQPIDAQGTKPVIVESRTLVPIRAIIEALGGTIEWEATTKKVSIFFSNNMLELWINNPLASLNGYTTQIDSSNIKVVPLIINGRTMLPLRFVAESFGIDVQWDATSKLITLTYVHVTVPTAPTLLSPSNGSTVNDNDIKFSWMPVSGADYYKINITSNNNLVHEKEKIYTNTYSVSKSTIGEGSFSWKVCAYNSAGWGVWSSTYTFMVAVALPSAPNLVSPSNNATLNTSNVTFSWMTVAGADSYRIQIVKDSITIHLMDNIPVNSYSLPGIELANGTYSWQVAAHNSSGWGEWSNAFYFNLKKELTISDIAKFVDRVVFVEVTGFSQGKPFEATGSGFIIGSEGIVVTNYHVIDGATSGKVILNDATEYKIDYVLGYVKPTDTSFNDLAILKINANNLPVCNLGDSSKVAVGDSVVAIGSPLGLPNVVSNGIISKVWSEGIIQITAPISHGNSGGPLFNMSGEVIGINTFKLTGGENLNFALPINWLKDLYNNQLPSPLSLEQVYQKEYGNIPSLPDVPQLISPLDGSVLTTATPTLVWSPAARATDYMVVICENIISVDTLVWGEVTTKTSYTVPSGKLSVNKKYVWTIVAHNSSGYSDSSKAIVWSFSISQPQLTKPVLVSPDNEESFIPSSCNYSITFKWLPVTSAYSYTLWIGSGLSGAESTNVYKKATTETILSISTSTLTSGQTYTWAVGASDGFGNVVWSTDRHFSIVKEGAITLISPYSGEHTAIPLLEWYSYPGASSYLVIVLDAAGNVVYKETTIITMDVVSVGNLMWDHKYYWAVFAIKDGYIIATSDMRYFYYTIY